MWVIAFPGVDTLKHLWYPLKPPHYWCCNASEYSLWSSVELRDAHVTVCNVSDVFACNLRGVWYSAEPLHAHQRAGWPSLSEWGVQVPGQGPQEQPLPSPRQWPGGKGPEKHPRTEHSPPPRPVDHECTYGLKRMNLSALSPCPFFRSAEGVCVGSGRDDNRLPLSAHGLLRTEVRQGEILLHRFDVEFQVKPSWLWVNEGWGSLFESQMVDS